MGRTMFHRWFDAFRDPEVPATRGSDLFAGEQGSRGLLWLTGAILVGVLWFLAIRIGNYFFIGEIYNDPRLFNLTKAGVQWDVFYGSSEQCGDIECHARSDYPESRYQKKMVLPAREFPLVGFVAGQTIYLRTKVEIPEAILASGEPIAFHSVYVFAKRYRFYVNDSLLAEGGGELLNIALPRDLIPKSRVVALSFVIDAGNLAQQGLANRYDLLIGSKDLLARQAFLADEMKTTFFLWFLLPKLTFCLIFALVYLFVSRSRALFCFVCYAFLGGLDTFLYSGYAPLMLPFAGQFETLGNVVRIVSGLYLFGFFYELYGGGRWRMLRVLSLGTVLALILSASSFAILGPSITFRSLRTLHALLYPIILFYGAFRGFRQRKNALDLALALFFFFSLLPASLRLWHVISDLMGLNAYLGVSWHWIHELMMFFVLTALAVIDVGRSLAVKEIVEKELASVNERLELARTVQTMLLPSSLAGEALGIAYKYYYEPAEKMSGDWLNVWRTEDRVHLFIGDVVGKGPQAALGVAVIAGMINDCRLQGKTVLECIERINLQLFDLFHGHITTTLSVLSYASGGTIDFYNAGTLGWISVHGKDVQLLSMRGMPLGTAKTSAFARKSIVYQPGTLLVSFTDGCLEGSRAVKDLMTRLRNRAEDVIEFDELQSLILQTGKEHVLHDDKTVVIVGPGSTGGMQDGVIAKSS